MKRDPKRPDIIRQYLVDLFGRLGYRHRATLTQEYLSKRLQPRYPWIHTDLVGVFERLTPIEGC